MSAPLTGLAAAVRGAVVTPDAPGYDAARQVWNLGLEGRPAAVVRCADAGDVQAAVRWAREAQQPLAVRAGGHGVGGWSAPDGAVVLDLRSLNQLDFAADDRRTLAVGGGCTWGEVLAWLEPHGLATPGAFDTRVGVAGFVLGGGYGALTRRHGLGCDNLVGADLVTADGALLSVDADSHPELLWALRGAGANFGVVTTLRLRLHPLEPFVAGAAIYPMDALPELLRACRDLGEALPDAATMYVGLDTAGQGSAELVGFHVGPLADARRLLEPFIRLGTPRSVSFREVGYRAAHGVGVETFPERRHNSWRADFVRRLDDDVLAAVATQASRARGERMWLVLEQLGGAVGRVAGDVTAFAHRDAGHGVISTVSFAPADRPSRLLDLQAELHGDLAAASIGRYVNYVTPPCDETALAAAYGANLPRLRALKRRWDPAGVFRHNVNLGLG